MTSEEHIDVLTSVLTEAEAAMIVAALKQGDVEAVAEGVLTSGFRAEAPGMIRILVRREDMDRAKTVLAEYEQGPSEADWSDVDADEKEE